MVRHFFLNAYRWKFLHPRSSCLLVWIFYWAIFRSRTHTAPTPNNGLTNMFSAAKPLLRSPARISAKESVDCTIVVVAKPHLLEAIQKSPHATRREEGADLFVFPPKGSISHPSNAGTHEPGLESRRLAFFLPLVFMDGRKNAALSISVLRDKSKSSPILSAKPNASAKAARFNPITRFVTNLSLETVAARPRIDQFLGDGIQQ